MAVQSPKSDLEGLVASAGKGTQRPSPDVNSKATSPTQEDHGSNSNGEPRANHRPDDRSSSLSDLEDRATEEIDKSVPVPGEAVDGDDTEAETERLEESPQKDRKHTDIVLSSVNGSRLSDSPPDRSEDIENGAMEIEQRNISSETRKDPDIAQRYNLSNDPADPSSDISSPDNSTDESGIERPVSNIAGKKRKRFSGDPSRVDHEAISSAATKIPSSADSNPRPSQTFDENETRPSVEEEAPEHHADEDQLSDPEGEHGDSQNLRVTKTHKGKKGKRKVKRMPDTALQDENLEDAPSVTAEFTASTENGHDPMDSNDEDLDMEDVGDGIEADIATRDEEGKRPSTGFFTGDVLTGASIVIKKKSAMDELGGIEKHFATFKDKLFDERVERYNEELAMLSQPNTTHPEYLAMLECIDRRRDEKIQYENTLCHYKLEALQRKSEAERAQLHSQYMQSVREIRDRTLEQVSEEWYQIQRERRNWEGDVPDYIYKYPTKRSQQITHQTAYNAEVSIIAGVAKYVGFPAAPDINGARSSEIDEDLQSMGISTQARPTHLHQPPGLKVSLSAPSNFTRQKPAAEEQFLESTPWANPQHPIHHQSITNIQRRASGYLGPFQTPVVQRQATDHNAHNGSASTIAEIQSGQGSSLGPTPTTLDRGFAPPQHAQTDKPDTSPIITPSKMTKSATEGQPLERATSGAPLDVVASHQSTTTEPPRLGLGQTPTSSTSQPEQAISPPVKTGTFASQKAVSPPNVPPSPFHKPDYSALGLMDHSRQRIHPLPSQQLGASSNNDLGPLGSR